jgi:large conductance mechanosensitive channel
MKIVSEFKQFAMKGNVLDLAVGIIIGGAFGKIVSSFVSDVLMPPIGLLLGGLNFVDFKFVLKRAVAGNPAVTLNYGMFLQTAIDFIIIAGAVFLLVKTINTMKKTAEEEMKETKPSNEEMLLAEIRDLLKAQKQEN